MRVVPFDAEQAKQHHIIFYSLPQDLDFLHIDPLMRPIVEQINASGWVWTAECCQGHPDYDEDSPGGWDHNTRPFLRLVTSRERFGDMMGKLTLAMRLPDRLDVPLEKMRMETTLSFVSYIWPHALGPWEQVNIYVEAHNVLQRNQGIEALTLFAKSLMSAETK